MIVYRTSSFVQIMLIIFLKFGYIAGIAISLYHYGDNPVLTLIAAVICMVFLLVTGRDEIVIYSDRIQYKNTSLFKIFTSQKVFLICDIKKIQVDGDYSIGDELYSPKIGKDRLLNQISIESLHGNVTFLQTNIYIEKLKEAVTKVEELLAKAARH